MGNGEEKSRDAQIKTFPGRYRFLVFSEVSLPVQSLSDAIFFPRWENMKEKNTKNHKSYPFIKAYLLNPLSVFFKFFYY